MKTVAILHGWSEGPWHTKKLIHELEKLEFKLTKDIENADVIIAHSIGTLMLPEKVVAELVVLVGVPFWSGKSVLKSFTENLKLEKAKDHGRKWWVIRSLWATLYALKRAPYTYKALRKRARAEFKLPKVPGKNKIIVVRNRLDTFSSPKIQDLLPQNKKIHFIELPGGHEDWWLSPQKYINLIVKHL